MNSTTRLVFTGLVIAALALSLRVALAQEHPGAPQAHEPPGKPEAPAKAKAGEKKPAKVRTASRPSFTGAPAKAREKKPAKSAE